MNLGTPADPSPRSVRKYLAEFLWDPRVIEMNRLLWWLVLHGVILRLRPRRSAHAYQKIWTPEGSPLLVESRKLADGLGLAFLRMHVHVGACDVEVAAYHERPAGGAIAGGKVEHRL